MSIDNTLIKFGKFKGKSYKELIEKNPKYCLFVLEQNSNNRDFNNFKSYVNENLSKNKNIAKTVPTNQRKTKQKIPSTVRNMVWNKYIGSSLKEGLCLCCSSETISTATFHCGHIISESNGGQTIVENLRPICGQCNTSIGKNNMDEFMVKYGIAKPENWDGIDAIDNSSEESSIETISSAVNITPASLSINNTVNMRHVDNIDNNDLIFISKTMNFPKDEKLEILYLTSHFSYGKIGISDHFMGISNYRIFSSQNGLNDWLPIKTIAKVTYKKNGLFDSDQIVCSLKNNQIKVFDLFWGSICQYFCDYLQYKVNILNNIYMGK